MDDLKKMFDPIRPTASRPLLGMTILVVEDSRFTCEALRLMCLRSGARIRRADNLSSAARHLKVYRPSAVIIDIGLPDGSGADLIEELHVNTPRIAAILGMSGDDRLRDIATAAGADGFLNKPISNLALFQETVLAATPSSDRQFGPRVIPQEVIEPDLSAYCDDIQHALELLRAQPYGAILDYVAQFLSGVAHCAQDQELAQAATELLAANSGRQVQTAHILSLIHARMETRMAI